MCASASALGLSVSLAQVPAPTFDLPAQPLGKALTALSEQADIAIYAPSALVKDKRSRAVFGSMTVKAALDSLLAGTRLEATFSDSGAIVIREMKAQEAFTPVQPAPVQTIRPAEVDKLVVYGRYSTGLGRALDIKRKAVSIVDAIVAADIGKLPASNVAEALQRLPGVTISREAGEGQFIGVRGLGPNFQSVTFNGVPIAVNENIRNSDQSGRQFRFRVLPADLVGGIVVTKSPTADLIDGGIGANIDIVTVKPLDRGRFTAGQVYTSFDERVGEPTLNGSLSAGWVNTDDTFGFISGVSYQKREVQFDRFQTFGYNTRDVDGHEDIEVADGWNTTVEEEHRRRMSFLGGIQWRPAQTIEVRSDILYSNFNNEIAENRVTYGFGSYTETDLLPRSARIKDGVLYAGTIMGGEINRNAEYSEQTHENLSASIEADWDVGSWTLSPSLSHSAANSRLDTPLQRIESRRSYDEDLVYSFDLGEDPSGKGKVVGVSTNIDLADPDAVPFRRYRIRPIDSEDRDTTFLFGAKRNLDFTAGPLEMTALSFGTQLTDRSRDYQRRDRTLVARNGVTVDAGFFSYHVPDDAFDGLLDMREIWTGPDFAQFARAFTLSDGEYDGVKPDTDDLAPTSSDLRQSYRVDEGILALYGRLDFESLFGALPVTGNLGLRWVETDTAVDGTLVTATTQDGGGSAVTDSPRTTKSSYSELLPSLNLTFELKDDVFFRIAASRTLTRPSLASLRDATVPNSATVSEIYELGQAALDNPNLEVTGVGGNPALKPYTSINLDASLEWYFEEFGALSVSVFHKDISDFISGQQRLETLPFAVHDGSAVMLDIHVNRPQNIGDATLSGIEFGFANQIPNGLGLSASAAFASSDIDLENADGSTLPGRLQGVSEQSYSITPFFERGPLEAHLSYTWRSEFDSNSNVTIASDVRTSLEDTIMAGAFGTLDFGASFALSDSFELYAEGVNLTDEHQTAYQGYKARPYQIHQYGRTFNLGLRGAF